MNDDYVNPWLSLGAEQPKTKTPRAPSKPRNPRKSVPPYGRQYVGRKLFKPIE